MFNTIIFFAKPLAAKMLSVAGRRERHVGLYLEKEPELYEALLEEAKQWPREPGKPGRAPGVSAVVVEALRERFERQRRAKESLPPETKRVVELYERLGDATAEAFLQMLAAAAESPEDSALVRRFAAGFLSPDGRDESRESRAPSARPRGRGRRRAGGGA
jgi:hypothetical protein